mgnify:CR=1 FL=1
MKKESIDSFFHSLLHLIAQVFHGFIDVRKL